MPNTVRVYPDGDVWVVKRDGASKAAAIRNTQKEAVIVAREIALNQGLSVTVHSPDGKIFKVFNPQDRSSGGDGCFITTACVHHYGLEDNCYQLSLLRKFRDEFLMNSKRDRKLVSEYYRIAPALVKRLEKSAKKEVLYEKIFRRINSACSAIEANNLHKAKSIYVATVKFLINYFKV